MADMIRVDLPWDSQPQEVADIAPQWSNGLLAVFNAGSGFFDLAAQKHYTLAGGIGLEPGSGGMGAIGNASSKYGYVDIPEASVDGATIFAVLSGPAATDDRALSAATSANNNNYFAIGTGAAGNTSKMRVLNVANGNTGTTSHTSADVFDDRAHAVALRWVRTVGTTAFVDGVLDTFAANTTNNPLPINRVTLCALGRTSFGTHWAGSIYLAAVFGRALSDAELVYLTGNPWQLFAPRSIWVPVSAGGGTATDLTIQDATHGHTADSLTLPLGYTNLTIADATHAHAADSLALTLDTTLAIADATHAHAADSLTLSVSGATDLTIQDATHGHSADSPTLTLGYADLVIQDALHGHTADNVTLGGLYTDLELILKILSNRQELNAGTGTFTIYDDDSVSVLFTASAWADAAGTVPYSGGTLGRIDALA